MDPWAAFASCLPGKAHLLFLHEGVALSAVRDGKTEIFRTWAGMEARDSEPGEWMEEVLSSPEWNGITDEVHLVDLEGGMDLEPLTQEIQARSGVPARVFSLESPDAPPWAVLLASSAERLTKGPLPLPRVPFPRDRSLLLRAVEGVAYTLFGLALAGGVAYGIYRDEVRVQEIRDQVNRVQREIDRRRPWNDTLARMHTKIEDLKKHLQDQGFRDYLRGFPARVLDLIMDLEFDRNELWLDTVTFQPVVDPKGSVEKGQAQYRLRVSGSYRSYRDQCTLNAVQKQFVQLLPEKGIPGEGFELKGPGEDRSFAFEITFEAPLTIEVAKK